MRTDLFGSGLWAASCANCSAGTKCCASAGVGPPWEVAGWAVPGVLWVFPCVWRLPPHWPWLPGNLPSASHSGWLSFPGPLSRCLPVVNSLQNIKANRSSPNPTREEKVPPSTTPAPPQHHPSVVPPTLPLGPASGRHRVSCVLVSSRTFTSRPGGQGQRWAQRVHWTLRSAGEVLYPLPQAGDSATALA